MGFFDFFSGGERSGGESSYDRQIRLARKKQRQEAKKERREAKRKAELERLSKSTEVYQARTKHARARYAAAHPIKRTTKRRRSRGKIRLF